MSRLPKQTLQEIAECTGCTWRGNPDLIITGVADLQNATANDASFLAHAKYFPLLEQSKAGAVFIPLDFTPPEGKNYLLSSNPSRDFQKLIDLFYPPFLSGFQGIHPSAIVHPSVKLGKNVSVGPYAVLDSCVQVGDNTSIGAHSYIGPHSTLGKNCTLKPRVTILENCFLEDAITIESGAVIGSCGFGYTTDAQGIHHRLNHVGTVVVEESVDIGANTTLDRARFKETRIGKGTKIDNLVHIAHNVEIGPGNFIAAQVGFAGSAKTGRYCVIGGQAGITGHITLDHGIRIAAQSGVSKSLLYNKGGENDYGGTPAAPLSQHQRIQVLLRQLPQWVARMKELEKLAASLLPQ